MGLQVGLVLLFKERVLRGNSGLDRGRPGARPGNAGICRQVAVLQEAMARSSGTHAGNNSTVELGSMTKSADLKCALAGTGRSQSKNGLLAWGTLRE